MRYFLLLVLIVNSMQRCSHPQAEDGQQVTEGCLQRECKLDIWMSSLVSNKCCYEREVYSINTNIVSRMSEDGCIKASIDCVEETPGKAKTVFNAENYCEDYATKEQLEEIREILAEQGKAGSGCHKEKVKEKDDTEEPKVLLLGPGEETDGKSEVLSLPDLRPLDCNIPVFPGGFYAFYVGRSTSDGVLMCGGETKNGWTSSCYLLNSGGYKCMKGLLKTRNAASSVETPLGLWISGGFDGDEYVQTTEIWNNNHSQPHVRLPEATAGHCITPLNNTHVLITGGWTESSDGWTGSSSAFIYSEEEGYSYIEDMKRGRKDHGCTLINDTTVLVAGGGGANGWELSTEYLDLTTLTWSDGQELQQGMWPAQFLGPEVLGPGIGGHLLIGGKKILKLEEEGLAQSEVWETKYNEQFGSRAFVVNQNVIC